MTRKRMLSPTIWEDPSFVSLSHLARLLFIGMVSMADDDGYLRADPRSLRRTVFGYDEDLSSNSVSQLVDEIGKEMNNVHFFVSREEIYAHFLKWSTHQNIRPDRRIPTAYPLCTVCGPRAGAGQVPAEEKRREEKRREENVNTVARANKKPSSQKTHQDALGASEVPKQGKLPPRPKKKQEARVSPQKPRPSGEHTPAEKARAFFLAAKDRTDPYIRFVAEIAGKYGQQSANKVDEELQKFARYWSELNKSGTKQRWELEKTFELRLRVSTWMQRVGMHETGQSNRKQGREIIA